MQYHGQRCDYCVKHDMFRNSINPIMKEGECSSCKTSLNRRCVHKLVITDNVRCEKDGDWKQLELIKGSKIKSCCIKSKAGEPIVEQEKYYAPVMKKILKNLGRKGLGLANKDAAHCNETTMNLMEGNDNTFGGYIPELNLTFQYKNALGTLEEIIYQVKKHKYSLDLSIITATGAEISIKLINGVYQ